MNNLICGYLVSAPEMHLEIIHVQQIAAKGMIVVILSMT